MWPQKPDDCVKNILWSATAMFLLNVITQLRYYPGAPFDEVVMVVNGLYPVMWVLIIIWFRRYFWLKGNNIVPIQNNLRSLKELWAIYQQRRDDAVLPEIEQLSEMIASQMHSFVSRKQYIYVRTYNYTGYIGKVGSVFQHKKLQTSEQKGLLVKPQNPIDLTAIDFIERVDESKVIEFMVQEEEAQQQSA